MKLLQAHCKGSRLWHGGLFETPRVCCQSFASVPQIFGSTAEMEPPSRKLGLDPADESQHAVVAAERSDSISRTMGLEI